MTNELMEVIEGGLVIRADGIEMFPEHSTKVGDGVEDLAPDDLVIVHGTSEGHRHKLTIRHFDPDDYDEEFIEERKEVPL